MINTWIPTEFNNNNIKHNTDVILFIIEYVTQVMTTIKEISKIVKVSFKKDSLYFYGFSNKTLRVSYSTSRNVSNIISIKSKKLNSYYNSIIIYNSKIDIIDNRGNHN